jgi:hypothetical protein
MASQDAGAGQHETGRKPQNAQHEGVAIDLAGDSKVGKVGGKKGDQAKVKE